MITGLRPYPAMRDSGVAWLGKVPEHWGVRRLGTLGYFSASGIDKHTIQGEPLVQMINYLDIYNNPKHELDASGRYMTVSCPQWKIKVHAVKHGDMLFIPSSETPEDIARSAVCKQDLGGTVYSYHVIRFRTAAPFHLGFKRYWCNNKAVLDQFSARCKGTTRQILTRSDFRSIWVLVPPLADQSAIARFLDHADRRIRRYIRLKEKLIALLEEEKQAIIHQAVAGRIDVRTGRPYPAYKPSGVEWLGDVPGHWSVSRAKSEFECLNHRRLPLSGTERGAMTLHEYDYYGASGVIDKVDNYLFDDELLLIAEDGANLVSRNLPLAIIARGKFWVNNHAHILKPRRGCLEYLAELMEGLNYLPWISGAAQPKLTQDRLTSILIVVPAPDEQDRIASYVSAKTGHLCFAIARAQREIELLREIRTRLIADVVTGKFDVREAAAVLPEVDHLAADDESASDQEKEPAEVVD